jgi:hypothetical protein
MHIIDVYVVAVIVVLMYMLLKRQKKQAGVKGWVLDQDLDGKGKRIYRMRRPVSHVSLMWSSIIA